MYCIFHVFCCLKTILSVREREGPVKEHSYTDKPLFVYIYALYMHIYYICTYLHIISRLSKDSSSKGSLIATAIFMVKKEVGQRQHLSHTQCRYTG